jgi:hypothetical protein
VVNEENESRRQTTQGEASLFPHIEASAPTSGERAHPLKKTNRRKWLLSLAILVLCCCPGLCANLYAKIETERPLVENAIDQFMQARAEEDGTKAYRLLSTRSKRTTALADIEELLQGNNYVLFEGYRSTSITDISLNLNTNTDPNEPQGTVAEVAGTIAYEGGFTGSFNAVLEKEGEVWRLFTIYITVPPDKFK